MSRLIRGNQRHLTQDDRIHIEKSLDLGQSFKDIAKYICKDPTTVAKEVKKHRLHQPRSTFNVPTICKNRQFCTESNVCHHFIPCKKRCASCPLCSQHCRKYVPNICIQLTKAPLVCNGCPKKGNCRVDKYYYRASAAHHRYRNTLVSSREGINLSEAVLAKLDDQLSPLIRNGQSLAHIYARHQDDIPFSSRTLYHYVDKCLFSVRNIDLPRKVKYKPRKKHKQTTKDHRWLEGRKYSDFTAFLEQHPETNVVEMDTVIGNPGGKTLLTLLFRKTRCMLLFLLPQKTQEAVLAVFRRLEEVLGTMLFQYTFPVILTDNGSEFINPILLETGIESLLRTNVFYCDPYASYQKGSLEKNHEFIRYVLPKGESFDDLSQTDVTLLMNHVNSTARASLNGRTPFELASLLLDQCVIHAVGLQKIEHDKIQLKPSLLKK